jgi:hypothetical protein
VGIYLTNTLDETVYDLEVEVLPGGNVLVEDSIVADQGFFDSNTGILRFVPATNQAFAEVLPGDNRSLNFMIEPGSPRPTGSFELDVNVYARRVADENGGRVLIGTDRVEVKYSSVATLGSQANLVSGPQPPQTGEITTYEIVLVAEAGVNDLSNTLVEAQLPLYVEWLDVTSGVGEITYNDNTRELIWQVGDINSGDRAEHTIQVSILPSISQVDEVPVLINRQILTTNDRFTGQLLQDSATAVTTELSSELGFSRNNGRVERQAE